MPATVRMYELVYVIAPDRSESDAQAIINKYDGLITAQGGAIERTEIWERRRLAYEIQGYTEGLYVLTIFRSLPPVEAELRRVFRISEDTLRFIIVRPDEESVLREPIPRSAPRPQLSPQPIVQTAPEASDVEEEVAVIEPTPETIEAAPEAVEPVIEAGETVIEAAEPVQAEEVPAPVD